MKIYAILDAGSCPFATIGLNYWPNVTMNAYFWLGPRLCLLSLLVGIISTTEHLCHLHWITFYINGDYASYIFFLTIITIFCVVHNSHTLWTFVLLWIIVLFWLVWHLLICTVLDIICYLFVQGITELHLYYFCSFCLIE